MQLKPMKIWIFCRETVSKVLVVLDFPKNNGSLTMSLNLF